MNDLRASFVESRKPTLDAVTRALQSGWYILGKEVQQFERQWALRCGVRHAVGVGNGLDAIEIALRALRIGPGDEVITTPMTAFASVLAIIRAGATPVLADIDGSTALLDRASVERCLTKKTKAIVLVHLYGQLRDMAQWKDFSARHNVELIEDCAQAHAATANGKVAGSFGRIGAYSFYPTKNLGAMGDGGAVVTDDDELAMHAARLRNYGQKERYEHPELGLNSRLDEVQAAILSERLAWLDEWTERRRRTAASYFSGIRNGFVELLAPPEAREAHVYHLFVLRCEKRDALQAHLLRNGVQALIHYPVPVQRQEPCTGLQRDPLGLASCDRHAATCLSLPCHPHLSDRDVETVIAAVNSFQP